MPAPHPLRKRFRAQWGAVVGCLILIAGLLAYDMIGAKKATYRLEQTHLQNLTRITVNILERHLISADALLTLIENEVTNGLPTTATTGKLSAQLRQLAMLGHGTAILVVLGPTGDVIASNREELQGVNFAHRHYFTQALAAVDRTQRIISPPFQTVLGNYTFTISRKIVDQQGRFAGVLMATMDTRTIGKLLTDTLYAPDMWASITHGNGVQIINSSMVAAGRNLSQTNSFFSQHLASPEHSNLLLDSTLGTGNPQLVAVATARPKELNMDQPLIVGIGRDNEALLTNWRTQAVLLLTLYLGLAAISLTGLWAYQRRTLGNHKLNARQQALIESSGDGIHTLDMEGRLIEANPAFLKMLGLDRSAIGQIIVDSFDTTQSLPQILAGIQRIADSGEAAVIETRHRCQDGREIDVEINCTCFIDDGKTFLLASSRDISARKQAESRLRQLSAAVEQSPESILITDSGGRIEYANAAFMEISGYSWEELQGQSPSLLSSGATPATTYQAMWDSLSLGKTWTGEFTNRRKNGEIYIESAIISPIHEADGRITHYLAIKQDITEKKAIEAELINHRNHLEALVTARTAELTAANQALAEANMAAEAASRTKAAFLANMSHEIRTPMNGIIGMMHILRRTGLTQKQGDCLDKVGVSAKHLLNLINDILDLSKIEAGKLTIEQIPISVEQIPTNVTSIISNNAQSKGLQVRVETTPLPKGLLGDATRITQALLNYATNAVKFTEHGEIIIRTQIETETANGLWLRFEVEDTGIGISTEALARLFTAFEQADNSTTRQYGGTGLGLSITRNLARLMGGDAGARSIPGVGSVFWFTVRLEKGEATLPPEAYRPKGQSEEILRRDFTGAHIMLVEDEPINQEIATLLLEEAGLVVTVADDGRAAVDLAKRHNFALILMDMQMPIMDGLEATTQIRQLPDCQQIPIVAMSANAFAEDRLRCTDAGMDDFIGKPAEPDHLYRTLLYWLKLKQRQ
jgi:PAS domain S-box-containing protein